MTTATAIAAIGPGQRVEFSAGKMLTAGTTVPASAKDPYLVNKICFLHRLKCCAKVSVIVLLLILMMNDEQY